MRSSRGHLAAPGMSFSTLLMPLGLYTPFIDGIGHFDLGVLIPGGIGALINYSGGYIVAFPVMCFVSSCIGYDHGLLKKIGGCVLGTLICYIIGTAWFVYLTDMNLVSAIMMCVVPFLPGDALKIAGAVLLSQKINFYQ